MNEQLDFNFATPFPAATSGYIDIAGIYPLPDLYDPEKEALKAELQTVKRHVEQLMDVIRYITEKK